MKDCDENQCAAGGAYGAGPCGKNMDCKNKCQGYECVCIPEYIPVILSKSETYYAFVLYIHTVVRPHSGVNSTLKEVLKVMYPLNNGLRYIQAIRQDCTHCRAIRKKGLDLKMQNHPKVRTTIAPPFYTIAIDIVYGFKVQWYPGSKRVNNGYALAIVCLLTGAVNILTLEGLHTHDVLSAIERHSNRYSPLGILQIQLRTYAYIRLLNRPCGIEVILREQNIPLKCCQPLNFFNMSLKGLDLSML